MNRIEGLYESIDAVPLNEWGEVCRTTPTWFMEPGFLRALERTLPERARIFHALFRGQDGQPAACASLCLYPVDLLSLASPAIRNRAAWVQKLLPGLTQVKILMCGLPFSAAQSHLAFAPGADRPRILEQLDRLLQQLARREGARLIVFKEFGEEERSDMDGLLKRGYVRGDSPAMYELENSFASFEEYSASLKAHYRTNIKRAQRKFAIAGCRFVRLTNLRDIQRVYTPEVHALYEAVVANSETRLEVLSHRFFLELARQLPDQLTLTLAYREDRLIGFTWELVDGPVYHFLFMGLDYSQSIETDLYFNLVYKAMDHAFRSDARVVHVGQTADGFKSLLGCSGKRRYLYGRGVGPTFSWILRQASGLLFRLDRTWHPTTCSKRLWQPGTRSNSALATHYDRESGLQVVYGLVPLPVPGVHRTLSCRAPSPGLGLPTARAAGRKGRQTYLVPRAGVGCHTRLGGLLKHVYRKAA